MLKNFFKSFVPDGITDEWEYHKNRVFIGVCFTTCLYATLYIPTVIIEKYYMALYNIVTTIAMSVLLPVLLKNRVPLKKLALAYVIYMTLTMTHIIYVSGGVFHGITDPQFLAIPPLFALFFFGYRYALISLVINMGILSAVSVMQARGVQFIPQMDPQYYFLQTTMSVVGHLLMVFMVVTIFETEKNKALRRLQEKNLLLIDEKKRSDELLLNILPAEVMEELKATGKTTARNYDLVTVLFADIKDFTSIVEDLSPEELVSGIDEYFETFDSIVDKHGVEKIKTVGDAYICASGLPVANANNPVTIVEVGLEMAAAVLELQEKRSNLGQVVFEVRIGVHSGPVVAGVVGVKKFAYDIWGDTVNMAARMQQHGATGHVNISGTTHDLVKHRFNCTHRGRLEAKHKGEVDMYFVDAKKVPQMAVAL